MQSLSLNQHNGRVTDLDAILANPLAYRSLPQVAWAFDPDFGGCRRVRWTNPREPRGIRRTAVAIAWLEAINTRWELN